jgi:FkbM family methyltransferase
MPSEHGQDKWVVDTLRKRGGYFLDSGAGCGIIASNTHSLEVNHGWGGICVEPNDEFFEDLKRHRKCHLKKAVLAESSGPVEFVKASWLGGIKSHLGERQERRISETFTSQTLTLEAITISQLFDEFKPPVVIDYWSLDTEGSELSLLKSFPWNDHSVTLLTIEHNQEEPRRSEIIGFLESKGYLVVQPENPNETYFKLK